MQLAAECSALEGKSVRLALFISHQSTYHAVSMPVINLLENNDKFDKRRRFGVAFYFTSAFFGVFSVPYALIIEEKRSAGLSDRSGSVSFYLSISFQTE